MWNVFRVMFDHAKYDEMRKMYTCHGALSTVYEKTNKNAPK